MKIKNLILSIGITLLIGMSMPGWADDTDLYLGKAKTITQEVRPNILFMLDSSGSMGQQIRQADGTPTGTRRIEVLKEALLETLKRVDNVNVGLGRFTHYTPKSSAPPSYAKQNDQTNAPILYPVSYVNASVSEVESSTGVVPVRTSAPIMNSSDDAEEDIDTGTMILDDPDLDMVKYVEPAGLGGVKAVSSATDDGLEFIDTGKTIVGYGNTLNRVLMLGGDQNKCEGDPEEYDANMKCDDLDGDTIVAVRFSGIGIPRGAKVESAEIAFMSTGNYESPLDLMIYGAGNPNLDKSDQAFSTTLRNYFSKETNFPLEVPVLDDEGKPVIVDGKEVKQNLPSVQWMDVKGIEAEGIFTTPDISPILQDIVTQNDWTTESDVVLLFKRLPNSNKKGTRGAISYENNAADAPKLRLYWSIDKEVYKVTASKAPSTTLALEYKDSGDVKFSNNMFLGKHKTKGESIVGTYFELPQFMENVEIDEAYIQFRHYDGNNKTNSVNSNDEPLDLVIYGEASLNAQDFKSKPKLSTRAKIDIKPKPIKWKDVEAHTLDSDDNGNLVLTEDVGPILSKMLAQLNWEEKKESDGTVEKKNGIVFLFERDSDTETTGFRRMSNKDIELHITFSVGTGDPDDRSHHQKIGLRFQDVEIPQSAKIINAYIDFTSGVATSGATKLSIRAENVGSAAPFTAKKGDISSRSSLTSSVNWNVSAWFSENAIYSTPELKSIVQNVVNNSSWCGGTSAMSFIITGDSKSLRIAKSYDEEPIKAPVLYIEYDVNNIPGSGCINQTFTAQISNEKNDAEELSSSAGEVYLGSRNIELVQNSAGTRTVGFRFPAVPVDKETEIVSANLVLTANKTDKSSVGNAALRIWADKDPDVDEFDDDEFNLSQGRKVTGSVSWPINEPWIKNRQYRSTDITPIITQLVSQEDWRSYKNMAFFITGSGIRNAYSFTVDPTKAAVLRIKTRGSLGATGIIVRTRLEQTVKSLISGAYTPIVDALYESVQYFRGGGVTFGRNRYTRANHFLSHPSTYIGAKLVDPSRLEAEGEVYMCPDATPQQVKTERKECRDERLDGSGGTYQSPIESQCQESHIVLLTDGAATRNTAVTKVKSLIGKACKSRGKYETCGVELAEFMQEGDHSKKLASQQKLVLHTVGFQLGQDWFELYADGSGKKAAKIGTSCYYDYIEDGPTYREQEVSCSTLSLVGYTENKQGTEKNKGAVKFLKDLAEAGGGKFYEANAADPSEASKQLVNAFTSIIAEAATESSSFTAPSVSLNTETSLFHDNDVYFSLFKPDQYQMWHGNVKKFRICDGTEGNCAAGDILDATGASAVADRYIKKDALSYWSSEADGSTITKGGAGANVSSPRTIYTYLGAADIKNTPLSKLKDKKFKEQAKAWFGDKNMEDEQLLKLVNWVRGDNREWLFADPLHSSPGILSYKDEGSYLFVGTNDGLLHAIDADSGAEKWSFLPTELLINQEDIMANDKGERIYGMDGTPTFWTNDGGDGLIKSQGGEGEFARMFMGMRRGGSNYYSFDVTRPLSPQLSWIIKGALDAKGKEQASTTGFERLGQTWSLPRLTLSNVHCPEGKAPPCVVLIFAGGYDELQDENFGTSLVGNAIYMVDPETGKLLWWVSGTGSGADLMLNGMDYAIPSNLSLMDYDGDGSTDRIYVGDVHGQLWRIDLEAREDGVGGIFASVSAEDRRRFFYPPRMVMSKDGTHILVTAITGTRPDPLGRSTQDQFYVFKDYQLTELPGNDSGNALIQDPTSTVSTKFRKLTQDDIMDISDHVEGTTIDATGEEGKYGWYINLPNSGEKGLSAPIVLKGIVFFVTFEPPPEDRQVGADACSVPEEGISRLYALNIEDGSVAYNLDKDNDNDDGEVLGSSDRSMQLRTGMVSDPVAVFTKGGNIGLLTDDLGTLRDSLDNFNLRWDELFPLFWTQE